MSDRRRWRYLMLIILLSAIGVQVMRSGILLNWLKPTAGQDDNPSLYESAEALEMYQHALVVVSQGDEGSRQMAYNVAMTLDMGKIPYDLVEGSDDTLADRIALLDTEDLLIIATEHAPYTSLLEAFLQEGGHVAVLIRTAGTQLDALAGIAENRGFLDHNVTGIRFEQAFFPGLDDLERTDGKLVHSVLDLTLTAAADVIASAGEVPIIWRTGNLLYVNSTFLMDKSNRGVLSACLAASQDIWLTTILGAKVVNIDDFPAPIKLGRDETIQSQYHMGNRDFYRQIWWSSMVNLAARYKVTYTGMVIGAYNELTLQPLLELNDDEISDLSYFGRKLIEAGGELGIHGYNHFPLGLDGEIDYDAYGYTPWESRETMTLGLTLLRDELEALFSDYAFRTYVAPSNLLGASGKAVIRDVFPEVEILAGLYSGPEEPGLLLQEFGEDPDLEGVYDFPRFSAGYTDTPEVMWAVYNGIAHFGLVNHFIHPDDLLDESRSKGLEWKDLEESLARIFGGIHRNFPNFEPMTESHAVQSLKNFETLDVQLHRDDESTLMIHYQNAAYPVRHFLYLGEDRIESVQGGDSYLIDGQLGLYLVEGFSAEVVIRLKVTP